MEFHRRSSSAKEPLVSPVRPAVVEAWARRAAELRAAEEEYVKALAPAYAAIETAYQALGHARKERDAMALDAGEANKKRRAAAEVDFDAAISRVHETT